MIVTVFDGGGAVEVFIGLVDSAGDPCVWSGRVGGVTHFFECPAGVDALGVVEKFFVAKGLADAE